MNNKLDSQKINFTIFIYLSIILVFSWTGIIAYGHGLGDIIYAGGLIGIVLIHGIAIWLISKLKSIAKRSFLYWIIGFIFLIISIYYTYGFTVGRGGEYSWNGNVFFEKSFRFN